VVDYLSKWLLQRDILHTFIGSGGLRGHNVWPVALKLRLGVNFNQFGGLFLRVKLVALQYEALVSKDLKHVNLFY